MESKLPMSGINDNDNPAVMAGFFFITRTGRKRNHLIIASRYRFIELPIFVGCFSQNLKTAKANRKVDGEIYDMEAQLLICTQLWIQGSELE